MKKYVILGLLSSVLLVGVEKVEALEITDAKTFTQLLNSGDGSFPGTFTLGGYNPLSQQVDSAIASFNFMDLFGVQSTVTFTLGASGFTPTGSTALFSFVTVGGPVGALALADLQDGSINFTVSPPSSGSVILLGAVLKAQVSDRAIGVPDAGTTIGLLGVGLLGLGSFSLRRKKAF